jgi:hypothetical protein
MHEGLELCTYRLEVAVDYQMEESSVADVFKLAQKSRLDQQKHEGVQDRLVGFGGVAAPAVPVAAPAALAGTRVVVTSIEQTLLE